MVRLGVLFIAFCCAGTTVEAKTVVRQVPLSRSDVQPFLPNRTTPKTAETDGSFNLTAETEVLLDGKACDYRKVPSNAVVLRIELAEDRKTILRIEFRSKK